MSRDYNFWIYIVTNRNQSVPYIGVTNGLSRRTWEHREGTRTGFASDYRCKKLIYYEHYRDIRDALARESQLKKWSRAKKIALIIDSTQVGSIWVWTFCEIGNNKRFLDFARNDKKLVILSISICVIRGWLLMKKIGNPSWLDLGMDVLLDR